MSPVPEGPGVTGVLFDFDGTLADTIDLILASYRHTVAEVEPGLDEASMRAWIGRPLLDTLEERYPGHGPALVDRYRAHNLEHHDALIRAVPGAEVLVADLQARRVPLGVVSSKMSDMVRRGMAAVGLPGVEVVIGLHESTRHKPDPEPLLLGAEGIGVDPGACVYVGDAVVDIRAARAAGMRSVAVTWGASPRPALEEAGPDVLVTDLTQLADTLDRLLSRPAPAAGG